MVVAVRRCWHDGDPPVKTIDPARMKRVTETASSLNMTIEKRERESECVCVCDGFGDGFVMAREIAGESSLCVCVFV